MSANKYESSELEGSGASKLVQLIKQGGYNKDVNVEIGTVISAPPNLKIKIERDGIVLEKDDLTVAEHLTRHKRIVTLSHTELEPRDIGDGKAKDYLDTDDLIPPITTYKHNYIELQFEDVLKVGNRVFVIVDDDSQEYYVIDRAVSYDGNNA